MELKLYSTNNNAENIKKHHPHEDYTLYLVFPMPHANDIANLNGKLIISPEQFLQQCLNNAKARNKLNLKEGIHHSKDYFTDLNHAERHRIPTTLHRLNSDTVLQQYGIISFSVYKDEQVKNKVYNQRISSVNPMVITLERVKQIYYPLNYKTEKAIDLYPLGEINLVNQEDFAIIQVAESIIQKAIDG